MNSLIPTVIENNLIKKSGHRQEFKKFVSPSKSPLKKFVGWIHLWLGLLSGIVVFILGVTGCIYVFEEEIRNVVYADRLFIEPSEKERLSLSQLHSIAQKALGQEIPLNGYEIPGQREKAFRFYAFKNNTDAKTYFGQRVYYYNVFINPYTGKVIYIENTKYEFFTLVVFIHYNLLLNKLGEQIVGWSTLIFIVLLITGIVLWWPKNKAASKQRFWFRWKESARWKRKNYDLHNIMGFYAAALSLIIALTGLMWAFEWFNESVQYLANGGEKMVKPIPLFSDTTAVSTTRPLDIIYHSISNQAKDADSYIIFIPAPKKAAASASALYSGTDRYKFLNNQYDQYTGKLLRTRDFASKTNGEKLRNINYDIHVGSILGLPGKILAFFASFVAASLPVTGFYIWWGRKKKRSKLPVLV